MQGELQPAMATAETALPSISTLTTLGPFPDTQEDFLKVGSGGMQVRCPQVSAVVTRFGGLGLHLALVFSSIQA